MRDRLWGHTLRPSVSVVSASTLLQHPGRGKIREGGTGRQAHRGRRHRARAPRAVLHYRPYLRPMIRAPGAVHRGRACHGSIAGRESLVARRGVLDAETRPSANSKRHAPTRLLAAARSVAVSCRLAGAADAIRADDGRIRSGRLRQHRRHGHRRLGPRHGGRCRHDHQHRAEHPPTKPRENCMPRMDDPQRRPLSRVVSVV